MLYINFVVHSEAQRLCDGGDGRPRRDWWQGRVLVDSASELLPWFPSREYEGMASDSRGIRVREGNVSAV